MLSDLFKSIPFLLSLAGSVLAVTDISNVSYDGVGCTLQVPSSSTGFNAIFYRYPLNDYTDFNNDAWVLQSFHLHPWYTSTTGVTDPNFTFNSLQVTSASMYGMSSLNIESASFQLHGNFIGMYNYLSFIIYQVFSPVITFEQNTNFYFPSILFYYSS
jgi:hypothetical protein